MKWGNGRIFEGKWKLVLGASGSEISVCVAYCASTACVCRYTQIHADTHRYACMSVIRCPRSYFERATRHASKHLIKETYGKFCEVMKLDLKIGSRLIAVKLVLPRPPELPSRILGFVL